VTETKYNAPIHGGEAAAILFDIQRFSIHDGPGIRTTLFFKGCHLRCLWCQNPESHKPEKEVAFYAEQCVECFACREACPKDAILDGKRRRIDYTKCNTCGRCVSVCAFDALRMVGTYWEAMPLVTEVTKDRDFFLESGGGITLSGGEPALQSGFLKVFLPLVKAEGMHVNMETSGMVRWEHLETLLPYLDLIYYDLKFMGSTLHEMYTGRNNRLILDNFEKLSGAFPNLIPRMPVVPTLNDTPGNVHLTARFLKKNHHKTLHLLRYHRLGEAKLSRIDSPLTPLNLPGEPNEALLCTRRRFEVEGICTVLSHLE
jgi:pyruvate formate lyase activating enzyme